MPPKGKSLGNLERMGQRIQHTYRRKKHSCETSGSISCGIVGLRDCGIAGLRDCGIARLRDYGSVGLRDGGSVDGGSVEAWDYGIVGKIL